MNGHLTDLVKTIRVKNAVVAGTSDQDTSVVDMAGYDACRFIWLLGDVTTSSVLQAEGFSNSASSTSSPSPVEEAETEAFTAGASDADNKLLIVDMFKPTGRYVFSRLNRADQNAVIDGCICELYRTRSQPQTADSSVLAQVKDVAGGIA